MSLPDKFSFRYANSERIYTAEHFGNSYIISWPGDCQALSVQFCEKRIQGGNWVVVSEEPIEDKLKTADEPMLKASSALQNLICEKKDASELSYGELESLRLTRGLINRLLCDR